MILIDDSDYNRAAAFNRGFQIIDPRHNTYAILVKTLQRAIENSGTFYSFHNYEIDRDIETKPLLPIT